VVFTLQLHITIILLIILEMTGMERKNQSISGEIEYRKKLVRQQILGTDHHFDDHKSCLDEVYESWMKPQIEKLDELMSKVQEVCKPSYFLELGSENSHLGLHLKKQYGIDGVCTDLSFDTLHIGVPKVAEKLGVKKIPSFLVADTHSLPFPDESFDFIFCFGSLHHFYDLRTAVKEIRRVCMPGGVFLTSYDPIKPVLRANTPENCSEISYGVLENSYTLWEYTRALKSSFLDVNVVYSESADRLELLNKIRRLKGSRFADTFHNLMPGQFARALRLLWFGMDDFTSINIA